MVCFAMGWFKCEKGCKLFTELIKYKGPKEMSAKFWRQTDMDCGIHLLLCISVLFSATHHLLR